MFPNRELPDDSPLEAGPVQNSEIQKIQKPKFSTFFRSARNKNTSSRDPDPIGQQLCYNKARVHASLLKYVPDDSLRYASTRLRVYARSIAIIGTVQGTVCYICMGPALKMYYPHVCGPARLISFAAIRSSL